MKISFSAKLLKQNKLYGTTTVGSKGQIVIPAKAREELDIKPGDKVLVMSKMGKVLSLVKTEKLGEIIDMMMNLMGKSHDEEMVKKYIKDTFGKVALKTKKIKK